MADSEQNEELGVPPPHLDATDCVILIKATRWYGRFFCYSEIIVLLDKNQCGPTKQMNSHFLFVLYKLEMFIHFVCACYANNAAIVCLQFLRPAPHH